jgi:hypothetical protein
MPRIRLGRRNWRSRSLSFKGINSITKTLADRTRRTYWYAWKGGPPLRGQPGTPEFVHSYNEAIARKVLQNARGLITR